MFSEVPYISIDRVHSHNMVSSILWKDDKVTKKVSTISWHQSVSIFGEYKIRGLPGPRKYAIVVLVLSQNYKQLLNETAFIISCRGLETWWGKRHMATRLCKIMINIYIYIFTHQLIISHMADCLQIMSAASQNNLWNSVKMFVTWTQSLK